jgi:hypothetical protein
MRHDPGLAASPRVRYRLKLAGSGISLPFLFAVSWGRVVLELLAQYHQPPPADERASAGSGRRDAENGHGGVTTAPASRGPGQEAAGQRLAEKLMAALEPSSAMLGGEYAKGHRG